MNICWLRLISEKVTVVMAGTTMGEPVFSSILLCVDSIHACIMSSVSVWNGCDVSASQSPHAEQRTGPNEHGECGSTWVTACWSQSLVDWLVDWFRVAVWLCDCVPGGLLRSAFITVHGVQWRFLSLFFCCVPLYMPCVSYYLFIVHSSLLTAHWCILCLSVCPSDVLRGDPSKQEALPPLSQATSNRNRCEEGTAFKIKTRLDIIKKIASYLLLWGGRVSWLIANISYNYNQHAWLYQAVG